MAEHTDGLDNIMWSLDQPTSVLLSWHCLCAIIDFCIVQRVEFKFSCYLQPKASYPSTLDSSDRQEQKAFAISPGLKKLIFSENKMEVKCGHIQSKVDPASILPLCHSTRFPVWNSFSSIVFCCWEQLVLSLRCLKRPLDVHFGRYILSPRNSQGQVQDLNSASQTFFQEFSSPTMCLKYRK
jgi:hypothetical protein